MRGAGFERREAALLATRLSCSGAHRKKLPPSTAKSATKVNTPTIERTRRRWSSPAIRRSISGSGRRGRGGGIGRAIAARPGRSTGPVRAGGRSESARSKRTCERLSPCRFARCWSGVRQRGSVGSERRGRWGCRTGAGRTGRRLARARVGWPLKGVGGGVKSRATACLSCSEGGPPGTGVAHSTRPQLGARSLYPLNLLRKRSHRAQSVQTPTRRAGGGGPGAGLADLLHRVVVGVSEGLVHLHHLQHRGLVVRPSAVVVDGDRHLVADR